MTKIPQMKVIPPEDDSLSLSESLSKRFMEDKNFLANEIAEILWNKCDIWVDSDDPNERSLDEEKINSIIAQAEEGLIGEEQEVTPLLEIQNPQGSIIITSIGKVVYTDADAKGWTMQLGYEFTELLTEYIEKYKEATGLLADFTEAFKERGLM